MDRTATATGEATKLAGELAALAAPFDAALAADAQAEVARFAAGEFQLAVFGEFKRGKSTLLNALLGMPVLPVGVVPVTAVITEVRAGPSGIVIHHIDGSVEHEPLDSLAEFVTESRNPENVRQVLRVEVCVDAPLVAGGVVLIDTPGFESVHAHDASAEWQLARSDAAIVVLSADAPFSKRDAAVVRAADGAAGRLFVVVNRVDHLGDAQRAEVRGYIAEQVRSVLGRDESLWLVSARDALEGRADTTEWATFEAAVHDFVAHDLARAARIASGRRLGVILAALETRVAVERDVSRRSAAEVDELVAALARLGDGERRRFDDEVTLLRGDVRAIAADGGDALHAGAKASTAAARDRFVELAGAVSDRALAGEVDELVERVVTDTFEEVHARVGDLVSREFGERVDRFAARMRELRDASQERAVAVLGLALPVWPAVELEDEPARFSYLFVRVGSTTEWVDNLARGLLPARVRRRRLVAAALRRIGDELDKHAGRARADLTERLDAACGRLVDAARTQVLAHLDAVAAALANARQSQRETEAVRSDREAVLTTTGQRLAALRATVETMEQP